MGHFIAASGGGSSNALCTASAAEVLSGYKALTKDSPIPVEGTLSASGNAEAGNVLAGKTFYSTDFKSKQTGSMPNRGQAQYAGGFGSGSGYVTFNNIPAGYYGPSAPEIRMSRDAFKTNVVNYFGISSVTNFSAAQYSSQKLLFTWANPGSGKMWSGIRIVGKQSGYPSSVSDGTVICDSAAGSYITGTLVTGTWYFRAWNYVTVSDGRWYGGYVQTSVSNSAISGEKTFTSGGSWTVPAAVRQIRYFLVGAGGGAYIGSGSSSRYSNGGGGGYTKTGYANVAPGQVIYITVGAGAYGSDGGASSLSGAVSVTANGGSTGRTTSGSGSGGSGGGGGAYGSNSDAGAGGSDGGSGGSGARAGGSGQGSTTRCPWDSALYSGGGGGGATFSSAGGSGGAGGGGVGGNYGSHGTFTDATDGEANTGGGGGGVGHDSSVSGSESTMGGSGIVRIKW